MAISNGCLARRVALSSDCFPEAALGPVPHLYPFIVNDPGEGTQAKRRAQAVIVDHLTPPLARAETYGRLGEIERLVDEYYAASTGDPRRTKLLGTQILELVRDAGLDSDCGIAKGETDTQALQKLDAYLCELKEMQIRDGLHIFGQSPDHAELLVALSRLPRGPAPHQASLIRALADDLALGFDPLERRSRRAVARPAAQSTRRQQRLAQHRRYRRAARDARAWRSSTASAKPPPNGHARRPCSIGSRAI